MATVQPTTQDLVNATKYASTLYSTKAAKEFFSSKGVEVKERVVKWEESITRGLHSNSQLEPCVELYFDKTSCEGINCFPWKKYTGCSPWDEPIVVDDGVNKYEACQKACHDFKVHYNTKWSGGKCLYVNSVLKEFCIIPPLRSHTYGYFNKQPPFTWDEEKSSCSNNDPYCTHFGMRLESDGECAYRAGVKVFRFLFGETLTRMYTNEVLYPPHKYRRGWEDYDDVFFSRRNNNVKEEMEYKFVKDMPQGSYADETKDEDDGGLDPFDPDDFYGGTKISLRILKKFMTEILEFLGFLAGQYAVGKVLSFIATRVSAIVFSEVLPTAIYTFACSCGSAVESLAANGIVIAVGGVLSTVGTFLLSLADPLLLFISGSQFGGLIADNLLEKYTFLQTDLKNLVTAKMLEKEVEKFNDLYAYRTSGKQKFDGKLFELTPLQVWAQSVVLPKTDPDRFKFVVLTSAHYLKMLKFNSIGQVIDWGETDGNSKKLSVVTDTLVEDVPQNVVDAVFSKPDTGRVVAWFLLAATFVSCGLVYQSFHSVIFLVFMLVSFCLLSLDILYWWSSNNSITGNPLFVYDVYGKQFLGE